MRDVVQEILHGITGQTLVFDALEGRPSSVTSVTVYYADSGDDGPTQLATTGSGAVDTNPATTTSGASGGDQVDPTAITLTSGTGVLRDRAYRLTSPTGAWEWVELVKVNGTAVVSRVPLINAYASGSTFESTRMSITIDPTWVADRGNLASEEDVSARFRVAWVYVVNGTTYRRLSHFDLVRYTATHSVTPIDVDIRFPGWIDRLPTDYRSEQGRRLIDQAWRDVRDDLRGDRKLGRWLRDSDVISVLVAARANLGSVERSVFNGNATADQMKAASDIYRQRYDQLVREPHTAVAVDPMGAQATARRAPLFRR